MSSDGGGAASCTRLSFGVDALISYLLRMLLGATALYTLLSSSELELGSLADQSRARAALLLLFKE